MIVTNALYAEIDLLRARVEELEESRDSWKREWRLSNAGLDMAEKRIAELEAENEKLRAERIDMLLHPEKYFSCYRDLKVVAAENAALRAEFDHAVSVNNPCEHTGLESFVCDICGYPDPRKVIAALRAERDRMKTALNKIASWKVDRLQAAIRADDKVIGRLMNDRARLQAENGRLRARSDRDATA